MKEAEDNEQASIELEFSDAEKKPDFQRDLKVYDIKVEPSGDKKKKYSGRKSELHSFVVKHWGMGTANSIDETSGYGNYIPGEKMMENDDHDDIRARDFDLYPQDGENDPLGPDQKMMEDSIEKTPLMAIEKAALAAKKAGIKREEAIIIVNQAYGKGMQAYGEEIT